MSRTAVHKNIALTKTLRPLSLLPLSLPPQGMLRGMNAGPPAAMADLLCGGEEGVPVAVVQVQAAGASEGLLGITAAKGEGDLLPSPPSSSSSSRALSVKEDGRRAPAKALRRAAGQLAGLCRRALTQVTGCFRGTSRVLI